MTGYKGIFTVVIDYANQLVQHTIRYLPGSIITTGVPPLDLSSISVVAGTFKTLSRTDALPNGATITVCVVDGPPPVLDAIAECVTRQLTCLGLHQVSISSAP